MGLSRARDGDSAFRIHLSGDLSAGHKIIDMSDSLASATRGISRIERKTAFCLHFAINQLVTTGLVDCHGVDFYRSCEKIA